MENDSKSDLQSEGQNLPDKVLKYETFVNEVLRRDLKNVLDERDKIYGQISEYLQLRNTIEQIQECKLDVLKTKVDLGCNFYCQAVVPDTSKICVCVGLGFFVEFTLSEALKFIEKKSAFLTEKSDALTADACRIKAHIKLVLEGLRELQEVSEVNEERGRTDVWV